jgi:hypothetical protein
MTSHHHSNGRWFKRQTAPLEAKVSGLRADDTHSVTGSAQRSRGVGTRWATVLCLGVLVGGLLIAGFGPGVPSALAASTTMVNLGQASTYAVLSGASVGNTVSAPGAPFTTLRGDLGVEPNTQPTGFPPGLVTGVVNVGNPAAAQAHADLVTAYNEVAARPGGTALAGALAGATISPGLYTIAGAVSNTTTVTLDGGGDPNAVFVFQVNGAMAMAAGSHVVLTNGARASRVFWQVNGAGAIGANAGFAGTLMALNAVAVGNESVVNGRAFALNGALTMDADEFYSAPPVVTITGGASEYTNSSTPTISGTTDVEPPGVVTVTLAGQTLTAPPSDGVWSATPGILANGTYPVVASTTDAAGNPGSATQQLTVDTVPPVVTIDGGSLVITNDPTPTIAGTTDVAPGTVVRVSVDAQTLTALVQPGGTWNVTPTTLSDGTRTVAASVTDPAGNEGTDNQVLTIDTVAPDVTIAGGANALTNDATPDISGTAAVAPGTTVTVTLADQTLTGPVGGGGAWSVTAAALSDAPHRLIMSVSDAAGNLASFTQWLTVDTVPPIVTITGGTTATTHELDPTITGTSNAAPGTTVTISIAGQTMTTLLQTKGTWNATPSAVGEGTWTILASAPDPAGNVGSARQTLTIANGPPSDSGANGPPSDSDPSGSTGEIGSANQLNVMVSCPAGNAGKHCNGSLSASSRVTSRGGKPVTVTAALAQPTKTKQFPNEKRAIVQVASGSYSLATGHRATIKLVLNSQGKKLLNRFYRLPATLKIGGGATATRAITFSYARVRASVSATWVVTKSSTSVRSLTVSRLPAKSKVTVTCHGGGCPFATRSFSPKAKSLALASTFGNAKLKLGARVQITVNVAGEVGRVASFAVRTGRPPAQTPLCLVPETHRPAACATP